MTTSEKIKQLIEEHNLTQKSFANKIGINPVSLCNNLKRDNFSISTLNKISETFNFPLSELIDDNDNKGTNNAVVKGYIEYDGDIYSFSNLKQLDKILEKPRYESQILPIDVKEIKKINEENKKIVKGCKDRNHIQNIEFRHYETYDATKQPIIAFKTARDEQDDIILDFGNQCSGYPFKMLGREYSCSETAYLIAQFSKENTPSRKAIQEEIQRESNGFRAKKYIRNANLELKRSDWEDMDAEWMLFVIWNKCQNEDFKRKLLSIPNNAIIIEDSTTVDERTNSRWGCKNTELESARQKVARYTELQCKKKGITTKKAIEAKIQEEVNKIHYIGKFEDGMNFMGKCLMLCRDALINGTEPQINYQLLNDKHIYLFGEEISINKK